MPAFSSSIQPCRKRFPGQDFGDPGTPRPCCFNSPLSPLSSQVQSWNLNLDAGISL